VVEGGNCLSGKERQLEYPGELYQGKGKILGVETPLPLPLLTGVYLLLRLGFSTILKKL